MKFACALIAGLRLFSITEAAGFQSQHRALLLSDTSCAFATPDRRDWHNYEVKVVKKPFGMHCDVDGITVTSVDVGSPAEEAYVKVGSQIEKVSGHPVNAYNWQRYMETYPVPFTITLRGKGNHLDFEFRNDEKERLAILKEARDAAALKKSNARRERRTKKNKKKKKRRKKKSKKNAKKQLAELGQTSWERFCSSKFCSVALETLKFLFGVGGIVFLCSHLYYFLESEHPDQICQYPQHDPNADYWWNEKVQMLDKFRTGRTENPELELSSQDALVYPVEDWKPMACVDGIAHDKQSFFGNCYLQLQRTLLWD